VGEGSREGEHGGRGPLFWSWQRFSEERNVIKEMVKMNETNNGGRLGFGFGMVLDSVNLFLISGFRFWSVFYQQSH
jgi:hypothetical protein